MSKRLSKKEEPLYEPMMNALKRVFSCLGECHLEVSAKGFSRKLKKEFDDVALYMITIERFSPDISGFVKTKYSTDIITVEVKAEKPMIKHIFQTKDYAQIFNAKYAILASPKTITEERRRLILKRREIISRYPQEPVVIARFDEISEDFEIDKELYYGSLPEPFKSHRKAVEAEKLEITSVGFDIEPERTVDVSVQNVGDVIVRIVEARLDYLPLAQNVTLKPREHAIIELSKEWSSGKKYKIELVTQNGKKVSFPAVAPEELY